MPDFPTGLPDIPAMVSGNPLATAHGAISQSAAMARILANIVALSTKTGIGSSAPGATAAILRRTASGTSAWGQLLNEDIADKTISGDAKIQTSTITGNSGTSAIGSQAIHANRLSPDSFDATQVAAAFGTGSFTQANVGDLFVAQSINAAKIQDGTIGAAQVADGQIPGSKLVAQSVYGANAGPGMHIGYRTIWGEAAGVNSNIALASILGTNLVDGTLATAKLAANAVTKLHNLAITGGSNGTATSQFQLAATGSLATVGGSLIAIVWLTMYHSVAGGTLNLFFQIGSGTIYPIQTAQQHAGANYPIPMCGFIVIPAGTGGGNQVFKVLASSNTAATLYWTQGHLAVLETLR